MRFLGDRIMVVAFEGWNDAGEAASAAVDVFRQEHAADTVHEADPEEYYDFQYTRPHISRDPDGARTITWPGASLFRPAFPGGLWILRGQEPARRWQHFVREFVDAARAERITGVLFLGSMMGDVPHTRPILINASSENDAVRAGTAIERGRYEGPVGIMTVLAEECEAAGMVTVSQWASVPHYVSMHTKSAKAVLALADKITDLTGVSIDRKTWESEARKWEASIDAAMIDDADTVEYVRTLERARDAWDTPAAKGEAIAREFEQFLRSDGDEHDDGASPTGEDA